ncbi:MAG: DUF3488 and transglutaminase-like domain-containing protein, partial [Tepidisphaeraceae bacterium]
FGLILIVYLFASLYCALLFHLKIEADAAVVSMGRPREKISPAALARDQRRLSVSMRRLTALVALFSIVMAVVVFLFFPRGAPDGLFANVLATPQVLTGFNDQVSMNQVTQIAQSQEIVAEVKVTQEGRQWGGAQPLLLRGSTLDAYSGRGYQDNEPWTWRRSDGEDTELYKKFSVYPTQQWKLKYGDDLEGDFVQDVTLQPSDTQFIFAMAGVSAIHSDESIKGTYWERDGAMTSDRTLAAGGLQRYEVWSTGTIPNPTGEDGAVTSWISPEIREYARRPEVSGTDPATGRPLADLLGTADAPADINRLIAEAMQAHLRANFTYTLDLTSDRAKFADPDKDPLVVFLTDVKKGHCEYFAGAMTLLCQSLRIPARMVVGYRSDEFNELGGYYVVRRSQAHAWVEVLTADGWATFDPTSANADMEPLATSWFGQVKDFFNYLDYEWGTTVVAYGQENRMNVMEAMNTAVSKSAVNSAQSISRLPWLLRRIPDLLDSAADKIANPLVANPAIIADAMMAMAVIIVVLVGYYFYSNFQLRRRAARIGLGGLPPGQRRHLARQLGYYDDLLNVLEQRRIVPAPQLTPMEFSERLDFLPNRVYHDIRRLTRLFYRVRYGRAVLNAHRRRRLERMVVRIGSVLRRRRVV